MAYVVVSPHQLYQLIEEEIRLCLAHQHTTASQRNTMVVASKLSKNSANSFASSVQQEVCFVLDSS